MGKTLNGRWGAMLRTFCACESVVCPQGCAGRLTTRRHVEACVARRPRNRRPRSAPTVGQRGSVNLCGLCGSSPRNAPQWPAQAKVAFCDPWKHRVHGNVLACP